jgi:hypothetical protein
MPLTDMPGGRNRAHQLAAGRYVTVVVIHDHIK